MKDALYRIRLNAVRDKLAEIERDCPNEDVVEAMTWIIREATTIRDGAEMNINEQQKDARK